MIFHGTGARAQFKSDRDRKIVHDILNTFSKECIQKVSVDGEIVKRLEAESKDASLSKDIDVQHCFQSFFSQIAGVYTLYQRICSDVSANTSQVPDKIAVRQLLEVNKYQTGIRPFHSTLNDCLYGLPEKRGMKYVVATSGAEVNARALQRQLDDVTVSDPFPATTVPYR